MSNKLEALRAAFGKSESTNQNQSYGEQYPFWQMKDGEQAVIRFLPDGNEDNPLSFLVEKLMHTLHINGQRRSVPCLKMHGESECPICDLSAKYYKADDKVLGKRYWRNKQHVARAVIIKDPLIAQDGEESHEGKVRTITLSFQIYEAINQAFQSGELDDVPFDFENGCDFIIKKKVTKDGDKEYASYVYSSFARRSTSLDPETVELKDLSTLLPEKVEYEKLEELLNADLTGSTVSSANTSSAPKTTEDNKSKLEALKAKTESTAPSTTTDVDVEDEAEAILASILGK